MMTPPFGGPIVGGFIEAQFAANAIYIYVYIYIHGERTNACLIFVGIPKPPLGGGEDTPFRIF
jgi:hypothetical protein